MSYFLLRNKAGGADLVRFACSSCPCGPPLGEETQSWHRSAVKILAWVVLLEHHLEWPDARKIKNETV